MHYEENSLLISLLEVLKFVSLA